MSLCFLSACDNQRIDVNGRDLFVCGGCDISGPGQNQSNTLMRDMLFPQSCQQRVCPQIKIRGVRVRKIVVADEAGRIENSFEEVVRVRVSVRR